MRLSFRTFSERNFLKLFRHAMIQKWRQKISSGPKPFSKSTNESRVIQASDWMRRGPRIESTSNLLMAGKQFCYSRRKQFFHYIKRGAQQVTKLLFYWGYLTS